MSRRRRSALAIAAVVLLLVAGLAARTWFRAAVAPSDQRLTLPDKPSIAILPFANLSGDPEQEYLSSGMTEDLITDASKLSRLFVIAHDSVLPYKGKAVRAEDVGRDLGVRYVLEGSIRRSGDEVRINARVTDASNGHQVWAERYDRAAKDTFAVQDDILRHVIADLHFEVAEAELDRIQRVPTQNLTAYESYMRGLGIIQHKMARDSVTSALELLQRSIDLDPNFAEAHAALGLLFVSGVEAGTATVPMLLRGRERAERALALNDSLPMAHIAMAFVRLGGGKNGEAIAAADRAMALGPSDADVYAFSAIIYNEVGKPKEAIMRLEKAMRLNPRYPDWYLSTLGRAYVLAEKYEEALVTLNRVLLSQPEFFPSRVELAAVYRKLGREQEARFQEEEIRRLGGFTEEIVDDTPKATPTRSTSSSEYFGLR